MEKVHKIYANKKREENYESGRLAATFIVLVPSKTIRNIYIVSFFSFVLIRLLWQRVVETNRNKYPIKAIPGGKKVQTKWENTLDCCLIPHFAL